MISAIVAVDNNWGIGYKNNLLESIPEDMKNFKALTTGNTVVMGRKTWDSLPLKPLPNRFNIIITKNSKHFHDFSNKNSCYMSLNLKEAINLIKDPFNNKDVFIIGGESIYRELLPFCERVYVTKIYKAYENVDTYFPNLDELPTWDNGIPIGDIMTTSNNITYQFWEYNRN